MEMKQRLRNRILEIVNPSTGIKGMELATILANEFHPLTTEKILQEIFDLIKEGELIEIEYQLSTMDYRTKSFILPKGTSINISK